MKETPPAISPDYLQKRIDYLQKIISLAEKELINAPTGMLKGNVHGKGWQYYFREDSKSQWHYIKKQDRQIAQKISQRNYFEKVLASAHAEIKLLKKISRLYERSGSIGQIYEAMPKSFQMLIHPAEETPQHFLERWKSQQFVSKSFAPDSAVFLSKNGERMRSKSEILIANALTSHNIPYLYEKPLMLSGYGIVYPDFTLPDLIHYREIYWEHHGMMDDPVYADKAVAKMNCYQKNHICPGINLITTFETRDHPLDTGLIELLISQLEAVCLLYDSH